MSRVVVVGSFNVDHVWRVPALPQAGATLSGEYTTGPGGKGFNQAVAAGRAGVALTDQGRLIATYALCGFANFSSIAIQIGGIGGLAPERRSDLARFGLRAVLGGSIATFMTATIAGVLSYFG